jgi:hypothetical protein
VSQFVRCVAQRIPGVSRVEGNRKSYRVSYFQARLSGKEQDGEHQTRRQGKRGSQMNLHVQLQEAVPVWKASTDERISLYERAWRYRRLLHCVAQRVLGNPDRAAIAVGNCLYTASRHATALDGEGAFRSWLVRVAIDEALAILHGRNIPKGRCGRGAGGIRTALSSSQYEMFLDETRCNSQA